MALSWIYLSKRAEGVLGSILCQNVYAGLGCCRLGSRHILGRGGPAYTLLRRYKNRPPGALGPFVHLYVKKGWGRFGLSLLCQNAYTALGACELASQRILRAGAPVDTLLNGLKPVPGNVLTN